MFTILVYINFKFGFIGLFECNIVGADIIRPRSIDEDKTILGFVGADAHIGPPICTRSKRYFQRVVASVTGRS